MYKKYGFVLWAWASTFLMGALIYWLATVPNFEASGDITNEVIKVGFRMFLYAAFFILMYRAFIATLKNTVQRLAFWSSKREAAQDAEFVLIIETLIVIITVLATTLYAIFEENVQAFVSGRQREVKDVLVSVMAILLTALIVYTMPIIGELEVAIKHKLSHEFKAYKSKK